MIKRPLTKEEKQFHSKNKLFRYTMNEDGSLTNPMGHKIVGGWNQYRGFPEDDLRRGANIPTIGGKRAWTKAIKEKRTADQMSPHLKVVEMDG